MKYRAYVLDLTKFYLNKYHSFQEVQDRMSVLEYGKGTPEEREALIDGALSAIKDELQDAWGKK